MMGLIAAAGLAIGLLGDTLGQYALGHRFAPAPRFTPEPAPAMDKTSKIWKRVPNVVKAAYEELETKLAGANAAFTSTKETLEANTKKANEMIAKAHREAQDHRHGAVGEIRIAGKTGTWAESRDFKATVRVPASLSAYGNPGVEMDYERGCLCVVGKGPTPARALLDLEQKLGAAYVLAVEMTGVGVSGVEPLTASKVGG